MVNMQRMRLIIQIIIISLVSSTSGKPPTCRTDTTRKGQGIDLALSKTNGAQASQVTTMHVSAKDGLSTCSQQCCQSSECNIAIFMSSFTHKNDKNCVLIRCVPVDKCAWEDDEEFLAAVLHKNVSTTMGTTDVMRSTTTETTMSSTVASTTTTTQRSTTFYSQVVITGEDQGGSMHALTTQATTTGGATSSESTSTLSGSTATTGTTSIIKTTESPTAAAAPTQSTSESTTVTTGSGVITTTFAPSTLPENGTSFNFTTVESFENLDGKAFFNPTTVGLSLALGFGILFTVLVIGFISKRVYDSWQRRHYNKMDYLVDGMYG